MIGVRLESMAARRILFSMVDDAGRWQKRKRRSVLRRLVAALESCCQQMDEVSFRILATRLPFGADVLCFLFSFFNSFYSSRGHQRWRPVFFLFLIRSVVEVLLALDLFLFLCL